MYFNFVHISESSQLHFQSKNLFTFEIVTERQNMFFQHHPVVQSYLILRYLKKGGEVDTNKISV